MQDRLAALKRWHRLGLAFLCGALLTGGHAPVDLPWLWFLALPVLGLLTSTAQTSLTAALLGWAAGFGYFVTGLHWVGHAFVVDPEKAFLMPLGIVGMPAGLALFWALAFWAARRLAPPGPLSGMAMLAVTITAVEVARTHVLTGFPWALPGYIWVETPVMQIAAWIGPHGMTLLTLLVTGLPGVAFMTARARIAVPLACLALLGVGWIGGAARLEPAGAPPPADAPLLRIVQPNAAQHLKWKPGHREEFYRRAIDATRAPRPEPVDAVIWPETAIYFLPENNPDEIRALTELAAAPLLAGALAVEGTPDNEIWFNSLFVFQPEAPTIRYDKHHLVPFGEYIPFPWLTDMFGLRKFGIGGGFGRGPGPQTLTIPGLPRFSALICYEAIFPHNIIGEGPRPEWLLQVTNDAWFGNFAGPQQHLAQARIRAIEQGLPVVRAANTGISAVIDAHGRIQQSLPLGEHGYFDARLPEALPQTVYARTGDWPAYSALVILLSLMIGLRFRGS